ncbi:MAG: riboflavin synthase [Candidatus Aminicenantes bacterium]|nr:riboflavin synthase [Candidatus Aminicenantes bacterium]
MFTGIIHHQGVFKGYRQGKQEIAVEVPPSFAVPAAGESIAVNGVCLSLIRKEGNVLFFNLARETLSRTNLGSLRPGERLNLELPVALESLLSGHLLTGHVDGLGRVVRIKAREPGQRLAIAFPTDLRPLLVARGSIAVNGVSLTIARLSTSSFEVALIPLTLDKSNLAGLKPGQKVNLECDIFGKYVYNWIGKKTKRL